MSKTDVPNFFRMNIETGNLDQAADFYGKLLGLEGRKQAGSRVYFMCGAVTLQVVDVSSVGKPHTAAKALYFTVNDLEAVFARAKDLDSSPQMTFTARLRARSASNRGANARSIA